MARPLRLEYHGALYHLTARGDRQEPIYEDDGDYLAFIDLLAKEVMQQAWVLYAFCLMGNHYHLLLETPEPNLVKGMRRLNGVYTQAFNRRHHRVGHVLQGRYKSILVDKETHLLELCRYVVLNPVRARMTRKPDTYRWSSYRGTAGIDPVPAYLSIDWVLSQFGRQRAAAQRKYQRFVAEGIGAASPWENVQGQVLLGGEAFVERLAAGLRERQPIKEIPRKQRFAARPSLPALFGARVLRNRSSRDEAIRYAHLEHGYSLSEIGRAVQLHYSTISRIVGRDVG
jgi:putative transposase